MRLKPVVAVAVAAAVVETLPEWKLLFEVQEAILNASSNATGL